MLQMLSYICINIVNVSELILEHVRIPLILSDFGLCTVEALFRNNMIHRSFQQSAVKGDEKVIKKKK